MAHQHTPSCKTRCGFLQLAAILFLIGTTAAPGGDFLRVSDPGTISELKQQNAQLISDYGSFQVWETADATSRSVLPDGAVPISSEIRLNTGWINTQTVPAAPPAGDIGSVLRLVQFPAPIKPAWRSELEALGLRVVSYIPNNTYLVYGPADAFPAANTRSSRLPVRWIGEYESAYKIQPPTTTEPPRRSNTQPQRYEVQLVLDDAANRDTLLSVERRYPGAVEKRSHNKRLGYNNVVVQIPPQALEALADNPDVVSIHEYREPERCGERQGQLMARNVIPDKSQPDGPGYLAWLEARGFTQQQFLDAGFNLVIVDDGLDTGSTTNPANSEFRISNNATNPSRLAYNQVAPDTGLLSGNGIGGHGNINASIAGGYNNGTGYPANIDSNGYHYGLGINPFAILASTKVFQDSGAWANPNEAAMVAEQYDNNTRISSDSWGSKQYGAYTVACQNYDTWVRDTQPAVTGNQEMMFIFSAGNSGPGAGSIGSPSAAKNILTVGASENYDPGYTDGCGWGTSAADDANDIAPFSSRGPCDDGRQKPDVVAPGTHIHGAASYDPAYDGTGVCDKYNPTGQTKYAESSGTSHSTPGVAGAATLVRQIFVNEQWPTPSPAIIKAWIMNSTDYLTGDSANDNLWSPHQGMGFVDLSRMLDDALRFRRDQLTNDLFTASGQQIEIDAFIDNTGMPVRITLAWTDAPGSTSGDAYCNDLDLIVTWNGTTYLGNVFTNNLSMSGGTNDTRNNVESVFLPVGCSGPIHLQILAANINSDGVPGNTNAIDQDFALLGYNISDLPGVTTLPANPVSNTSARLQAEIHPRGQATAYYFDYGVERVDEYQTPRQLIPAGTNPVPGSITITGLLSRTTYRFRVVASNQQASVQGQTLTLTTTGAPLSPTLWNQPASNITYETAHVSGKINAHGEDATCWVEYGTDEYYGLSLATTPSTVTGSSPTSIALDLPGLAPDTTYHFRLAASNAVGQSASPDQSFTTASAPTTPQISNSTVQVQTDTATFDSFINPEWLVTHWWLEYGTDTTYQAETPHTLLADQDQLFHSVSTLVTGLQHTTLYHYRFAASNALGTTYSPDQVFISGYSPIVYEADLSSNPHWDLDSDWAWGVPDGAGGEQGFPDPTGGYTGTNVMGYNLAGDYPNNLAPIRWATTPAIDCSAYTNTHLSFMRWLNVEGSDYDQAHIQLSSDRLNWTTLWENPSYTISENSWHPVEYDISSYADGLSTLYIRWGMGLSDYMWPFSGWNLDDIRVTGILADHTASNVYLNPALSFPYGAPGDVISCTITALNYTLATNTLDLAYTAGTWELTGPAGLPALAPAEETAFTVELTIPTNAPLGEIITARVSAVSLDGVYSNHADLVARCQQAPEAITTGYRDPVWNQVALQGTVNPHGGVTRGHFEYGTDTTYGAISETFMINNGSSAVPVEATIGGLLYDTDWHFRLVATNSSGNSVGEDQVLILQPPGSNVWNQPPDCTYRITSASQYAPNYPFDARTADDFLFTNAPGAIRGIRWWGSEWNGDERTPDGWNVYIYDDNGGEPGTILSTWTIPADLIREELECVNAYRYSAVLKPSFIPEIDKRYWIVFQAIIDFPPQAGWLKASGWSVNLGPSMTFFPAIGLTNWNANDPPHDKAFELHAEACGLQTWAAPEPYGLPEPFGYGWTGLVTGTWITNTITSPVDETNGTRFACSGWTGLGDIPTTGALTVCTAQINQASTITWNWHKECLISLSAPHGSIIGAASGWTNTGLIFDLWPQPDNGYAFAHWKNQGTNIGQDIPLTITSDIPWTLTAKFSASSWDVDEILAADTANTRMDMSSGMLYADFDVCLAADAKWRLGERFLLAIVPSAQLYLAYPDGTGPNNRSYADITSGMEANLRTIGNRDRWLDPGESVRTPEVAFWGRDPGLIDAELAARRDPLTGQLDPDRDTIPTDWEEQFGLNPNNPADGALDQDADGISSAEEYVADTDPFNAHSYLRMDHILAGSDLTIGWAGGTSVVQQIQWAATPNGPWSLVEEVTPPTPITNQATMTEGSMGLYRIRALRD